MLWETSTFSQLSFAMFHSEQKKKTSLSSEKEMSALPLSFLKTQKVRKLTSYGDPRVLIACLFTSLRGIIPATTLWFCFVRSINPEVKSWYDYAGWK